MMKLLNLIRSAFVKRKAAFLLPMLLLCGMVKAQNITIITHRIDSLIELGLPKSALGQVAKLDQLARKNKNASQQLRAAIYRMNLQSFISEISLAEIIDTLQNEVSSASFPVKPVLQSLLASMYYRYYQQNRWQFGQRTRLARPSADFTKWDLQTIIMQTNNLYQQSLSNAGLEQATSIELLSPVLKGDATNRYLRPTLYDLLVHRALDFFLSEEPSVIKPQQAFSINDARFFAGSRTFADLKLPANDTSSIFYLGLKHLQLATRFHLQQHDEEALADLDIKRLNFLQRKAKLPNKDSLYTGGLHLMISTFARKPIMADALLSLGNYYQRLDSLILAKQYFEQAIAAYPKSLAGQNAVLLIKQIQRNELSSTIEAENLPGQALLGSLTYRNVKAAKYQIYRLNQSQKKIYRDSMGYAFEPAKIIWKNKFLNRLNLVQERTLDLPDLHDYRSHRTEFRIDSLPIGSYVIIMKTISPDDSSMISDATFQVSRLAYINREQPDGNIEAVVTDRETGVPLANAQVTVTDNQNSILKRTEKGQTNALGSFVTKTLPEGQVSINVILGTDTLNSSSNKYIYTYRRNDNEEGDLKNQIILFTDRQIYRPGQTIFFKGIDIKRTRDKRTAAEEEDVKVEFKDVNGKVINTLNLKTNEFGSFSGSFVIPQSMLNGEVFISTENGQIGIRVEEYKRPTFKAEFSQITESYRLNDSLKIKGTVMAFSGYGISQARVAYHVTRTTESGTNIFTRRYNTPATEVKTDTVLSNEQGQFELKFKGAADASDVSPNTVFNYNISIDVTDASGETHSANTAFRVGNNNISINTSLPDQVFAYDTSGISGTISNLNNKPQKGNLSVRVFALKNPEHLFKRRLWQVPDVYAMSRQEYALHFPYYAYRNEDESRNWQRLTLLSDTTITTSADKQSFYYLHALNKQPSGIYRVIISARNEKGDTTSMTRDINLVATQPRAAKITDWLLPEKTKVKPGEAARFTVGINEPTTVLMEKYSGKKIISSQWLSLKNGQQSISVPVAAGEKQVGVQFMMICQNRVYSAYQAIDNQVPEKSLNIKTITFRNKLQPGDKEQWKLQVTGNDQQAAEMVAGLYDASLDDISTPADWRNKLDAGMSYPSSYFQWSTYDFIREEHLSPWQWRYNNNQPLQRRLYEELDLMGYDYYGGYNNGYHQYLRGVTSRSNVARVDADLDKKYFSNAALVKTGVDVTGTVTDQEGQVLPGVSIGIKASKISIQTNSKGHFKIKVPVGETLMFRYIGYDSRDIQIIKAAALKVVLKSDEKMLHETVIVGYGTQRRESTTGSSVVLMRDLAAAPGQKFSKQMIGRVAGLDVMAGAPGMRGTVNIRGIGSVAGGADPLYIVDGVPVHVALDTISPDDIESIDVLKDASAIAMYGAKAANGVIIITTKSGKAKLLGSQPIIIRKNFNETAFFYPQLRTDSKGQVLIDFTIPEALTNWKFRTFAHTKELRTGYLEEYVVTQKQLSITANTPRFLRDGDTLAISARLVNLTAAPLKGVVNLQLFNAATMQPVNLLLKPADARQSFDLAGSANQALSFKIAIPFGLEALTFSLTADAGQFTDGEENTLPVLTNRMLVTESMPMMIRAGQTRAFNFDKLTNQSSSTLKNKTLTLEYTQNPAWYAVQALPYMMEYPYECSEQIFSRYYANSMASGLINKMPAIKKVFDEWRNADSKTLVSNLEKNAELKATLLEESPWLRDAVNENEQKKRIALLFDLNHMSNELQLNLDKLQERQLADGGFTWFGGDIADAYITRHILAGIGQLYHTGMVSPDNNSLKTIVDKALPFLDNKLLENAQWQKNHQRFENRQLMDDEIHAYYTRSYFAKPYVNAEVQALLTNYLKLAEQQWLQKGLYEQAMIAITMLRNQKPEVAQKIIASLNERAQHTDELGMYWGKNQLGYYWYQSPIETQCLMIELLTEAGEQDKAVAEMKIWLLRNKQTNNWKTTKATAAACYALLLKGDDWLTEAGTSDIRLDGQVLATLKPGITADAGTGYFKTSWADEQIKPALGRINITNNGKTISWGAMYWQYLENLDKITPSHTDLHLERKYFILRQTASGPQLTAVDATHQPKTGDVLKVVVYLKAGRDYEYVQLKDMRPAGTEPMDALSTYKFQEGLYYYQVTRDVATNFFISQLNKGNYVFEYQLRVAQPGNYSTGISTIQCMYAPEFNAHSEGSRMVIK